MKSLFFDSQVGYNAETGLPTYDRPASAADLREMTKKILNNGVYPNPSTNFQVFAHTAEMTVTVKPGVAWIEGAFCAEAEDRMLVLQASETLDRIDRIVLRLDLSTNARKIDLYVIKGTAAVSPIAPAITRNNTVYELCIANIFVAKNTTVVTGERITDTRMDSTVCGWVTGVIDQVDTTTIYNQYRDWWAAQQDTTGYLTVAGDNPSLQTASKKVLGAINELNTIAPNAAKLGGQLPAYYAKKTEVDAAQGTADAAAKITDLMLIGNRGQRNDANNIPNGVTWCDTGTPHNAHSFVWQIQYDSSDKVQLSILCNKGIGAIAYRSSTQNSWSAWVEMMPMTGGVFSGGVQFNSPPRSGGSGVYTTMTNVGMWSSSGTLHMMSESGLNVVNQGNNGFKPINASAFNVNSSKSVKTDIAEYAGALEKINTAKIYKYTRTDDGAQQIGLITEDVTTPAELKHEIEKPNGNGEKPRARAAAKPEMTETIDLYSFISLVSQAVKELKTEKDAEIEVLKSKITALEGK